MMKLKTLALAAAASLAFTAPALAADAPAAHAGVLQDVSLDNGALTGVVIDAAGTPRAGVTVEVARQGRVLGTATTAADGSYRVAGLRSGHYTVLADGQAKTARVWNGVAPAGATQKLALVAGPATVNGNHGHYAPPAPCNTGCPDAGPVVSGGAYCAPAVTYSQSCQTVRTKRCGRNGFLGGGLSDTAAVTGLALGITGVAIASSNRDDIDHLEREAARNRADIDRIDEEVARRGAIMDAREPVIEDLINQVNQLEQDLADLQGGGHVTP